MTEILKSLIRKGKFVPYKLPTNACHRKGCFYWSGKYQRWYKVYEICGRNAEVMWSDGRISTLRTPLDSSRDFRLRKFDWKLPISPENSGVSLTFAEIEALGIAGVIPDYENRKCRLIGNYQPKENRYYFLYTREDNLLYLQVDRRK